MRHPLTPASDNTPDLPGLELVAPFVDTTEDGKSNTIELFDALMTYSGEHAREGLRFIEATKHFRGRTFQVRISPAVIKRKNGAPATILPGLRENLVEKTLRKMAADDLSNIAAPRAENGHLEVWVRFTLYRLRKVLAEQNHHFTIAQLEEALKVLQGSRLEVSGDIDNDAVAGRTANILQDVAWCKRKTGDKEGREHTIAAKFHPFVTRSIVQRTFRRIDFARLMRPKNELARWIYLRMSHNYTQAGEMDLYEFQINKNERAGYHLSLTTILRETGFTYADTTRALRAVRRALTTLREQDVIMKTDWLGKEFPGWIEVPSYGPAKGNRPPLQDCRFVLFPSQSVIDDVIKANRTAQELRRLK